MKTFKNFIGGDWVPPIGGEYFENRNPADVDRRRSAAFRCPARRTSSARSSRRGAASSCGAATPAPARGDVLRRVGDLMTKRKDEIADLMTREMGKPLTETRGDVQEGIDTAYYAATRRAPPVRPHRAERDARTSGR